MKMENTKKAPIKNEFLKCFKNNYTMYLFLLLPIAYFIIFKYIPMSGNIIAFRKFVPGESYFGSEWKGLDYFKDFIESQSFWKVFFNTIRLSLCTLIFAFPMPIIFALLINELSNTIFKKTIQSLTIIPKFLSTVVVVMIVQTILAPDTGVVNMIIKHFGGESVYFVAKSECVITSYSIHYTKLYESD